MQKVKKEPILLILSVLAIFVLLIVSLPSASDRAEEKAELMPLNDGWYYMKDGIKNNRQSKHLCGSLDRSF